MCHICHNSALKYLIKPLVIVPFATDVSLVEIFTVYQCNWQVFLLFALNHRANLNSFLSIKAEYPLL